MGIPQINVGGRNHLIQPMKCATLPPVRGRGQALASRYLLVYTLHFKKRGSTFVIITLEKLV